MKQAFEGKEGGGGIAKAVSAVKRHKVTAAVGVFIVVLLVAALAA